MPKKMYGEDGEDGERSMNHLTDEQFTECILETPTGQIRSHLSECDACRHELSVFQESMAGFGMAAEGWSESMPRVSLRTVAKEKSRANVLATFRWTTVAAALLLALATPVLRHYEGSSKYEKAAMSDVPADSPAQIAEDDRLMKSVFVALAPQDTSPYQEYGVRDETSRLRSSKKGTKTQ